jgi:hypothetical protein
MQQYSAKPLHRFSGGIATAGAAVVGTPGRVMAFLLFGGSGNTKVEFTNDADGTGTVVLGCNAVLATSKFVDLSRIGGVNFSSQIYAKVTGTGGICYVWFEA